MDPHKQIFWCRDVRNFIADNTATNPELRQVLGRFKMRYPPKRDSIPEGLLTRLKEKFNRGEVAQNFHPAETLT